MCQYFTICKPPLIVHQSKSQELDLTKLLLVDNCLVYLLPSQNQIVILDFPTNNQFTTFNDSNTSCASPRILPLKSFLIQEQTHFILFKSQSHQQNLLSTRHHFAILTTSQIHHISIDLKFGMLQQHSTYALFPAKNNNEISLSKVMLNQQISLLEMEQSCLLFVVGFVDSDLRGITYRIKIADSKVKLQLENRIKIDIPKQVRSQFGFNISEFSNSFFINLYPLFVEKSLPLRICQFNLEVVSKEKSFQYIQLKQHIVHQLVPLHAWFHVKCVLQNEQDFYVCYTKYVKFQEKKQNMNTNQIESLLWIYDSYKQYTKNLIDIKGALVDYFILSSKKQKQIEGNRQVECSLGIISLQNPEVNKEEFTTTIVKMDSKRYNPRFGLPLTQYPVAIQNMVVTFSNTDKNKGQIGQLKAYQKVSKKYIYTKIYESLNFQSETLLKYLLHVL